MKELAAAKIRTIVIGFGADVASGGAAANVLNAMAQAGGFARTCPNGTDAECGGAAGSCNASTKVCTTAFYQATDSTSLTKALTDIGSIVGTGDPCVYNLDAAPSDPSFLTVLIDGVNTQPGPDTWNYSAGKVTFTGALCTKVSNATPQNPVHVEFRIVQGL